MRIDRRGDDAFSFMHGYGLLFELREGPGSLTSEVDIRRQWLQKGADQAWNALLVIGYGSQARE